MRDPHPQNWRDNKDETDAREECAGPGPCRAIDRPRTNDHEMRAQVERTSRSGRIAVPTQCSSPRPFAKPSPRPLRIPKQGTADRKANRSLIQAPGLLGRAHGAKTGACPTRTTGTAPARITAEWRNGFPELPRTNPTRPPDADTLSKEIDATDALRRRLAHERFWRLIVRLSTCRIR